MKSQKKRAVLIQIAPLWISQPRDRNRTIRHPPRDPTREALQKSAKSSKRSPKSLQQSSTGWRRLIGSPKLQIIFHKKATKCRSLLRKMTYKDKGSYESSPPCINRTHFETIRHPPRDPKRETPQKSAKSFQKKTLNLSQEPYQSDDKTSFWDNSSSSERSNTWHSAKGHEIF